MQSYKDWLKENSVAIDGTTIKSPEGTSKNPEQVIQGEWNEVGIAPPVGDVKQLTGSAKPTGEVAHLPSIDTGTSLSAIKAELAKPGLQEAIAKLNPTLSEALISLSEGFLGFGKSKPLPIARGELESHGIDPHEKNSMNKSSSESDTTKKVGKAKNDIHGGGYTIKKVHK